MREENLTGLEGLSELYSAATYTNYLQRALGVILESNLCSEIELPEEKKSEKPNFKQTKK
jgi:hypothetical protein